MRMCRVLVSTAWVVVLGGCPTPPPEEQGPFLSDTPLWTLEPPESLRQSCFGASLALGDVNGDGKQDLVVAAPPCSLMRGKGSLVIYAGEGTSFSTEPVIAEMDWQNPNPSVSGRNIAVSVGDVNGDRFADILVRSQAAGTLVFAGQEDLGSMLQAPLFRVPFLGAHYNGVLVDLDGDGLDELVVTQGAERSTTLYRPTPGAEAPFTQARVLPGWTLSLVRVGDLNGDGAEELLRWNGDASELFLGCEQDQPGVCEGGLSVSPSWTSAEMVRGFFPDQNGDGHPEVVISDPSRLSVHLFQPEGGFASAPIWRVLGDGAFPSLAPPPIFVGDLDKDGQETEFLLGALGRLYAFFPKQGLSAELRPEWAWPRSNALGPEYHGDVRYVPVRAGDLDGDGYADIIVGMAPPFDQLAPTTQPRPGRVVAFGGGRPPRLEPAPFLRGDVACGLGSGGGKPDVTVDGDILSRTVFIDQRNFPETACEVMERCVGAPGDRRLLRFSVSIPNLGSSAVRIPSPEERPELYEFDACHQHDHLIGFASYELLDTQNAVVAVGRKQGFFLVDYVAYCGNAPPPASVAEDGSQSISPGWSDVYSADYPCQWLDITDVPDGTYTLRVGVDKNDLIDEQDVLPNSAEVTVRLSGSTVEVLP
ncbi:VCBS repeat-containing protein [Archangium violaceum]|uniref:FG-GAP-like repeat-containing protein n=1 Tax=Archangium violaceum TaxID=83451 RepID=UPI00193B2D1D|nr:FG-GAP-like repeat-containing protein [Archangium violaceum]QRK07039.1 VCBS repeat-containing protein [Archangium violaceum]